MTPSAPKVTPAIRRATADDAPWLADFAARTFSDTFAADNKPEDMAAYLAATFGPEKQAAELADPRSTFLIAHTGGIAAGYAQLRRGNAPTCVSGPKPVELARLYASQEFLGRGVGGALMRECLEEGRRTGHRTMWLGVWERNERAQVFYRRWRFRTVGSHIFHVGSDLQTDLLMELALP